jgi:hypothetical protein
VDPIGAVNRMVALAGLKLVAKDLDPWEPSCNRQATW